MRFREALSYILLYMALYAAFGVASPFWPKFFQTKALVPQQIGQILAAAMLMRLVAGPAVAMLADWLGSLRAVLAGCAVLSAAASLALGWAHSFVPILIVALVQAAALAPTTSMADALSVNVAGTRLAAKVDYGWIRGAASAAFVLGTLAAGQLVTSADLSPIIWMNAGLLVSTAAVTALLPRPSGRLEPQPRGLIFPIQDIKSLLGIARFRTVIAVAALVYGSHAMQDAFAVVRWSDAGVSTSAISFLWSEAVTSEVLVFVVLGPALLERFGVRGAAMLAATAGIVRWSVAAVTTSIVWLALIQPLHGLTFALLHLACMRMMASLVSTRVAATAQALYAFGSGLVTAALTLLSGTLYALYAGAAFFPMAALCVAALPLAWFGLTDDRPPPDVPG
jgi:MFS transporter, PPP family, 3-phenylpropionic acid transporter